jgi:hypothetical protein
VDDPSLLAGAVTTLAFLVAFSDSIKLFFFMTIAPQGWILVKREEADPTSASLDSNACFSYRYLNLVTCFLLLTTAFRVVPP